MQGWQSTYLGAREVPRELSSFELQTFFTYSRAERVTFAPAVGLGKLGTLRHNSRAVYQRYVVWYDANPSDLNDLPPEMAAKKYVKYMSGAPRPIGTRATDPPFCDAVVHAIAGAHVDTQLRRHGFWHTAVLPSASHHLHTV